MNRGKMTRLWCAVLAAMMMLAACNKDNGAGNAAQATPLELTTDENGVFIVGTVEELLEAIRPDANIRLEPGRYNISEHLSTIPNDAVEEWNARHDYITLAECYDGLEVVVEKVSGLYIFGDPEDGSAVEIVTEPRYAAVLSFRECSDVYMTSMTMGHTDTGDCSGNVIDMTACRGMSFSAMDLYGCGVCAIGAFEGSGDISFNACTLRECSDGPFEIYGCKGDIEFNDCFLTGSGGYGQFDDEGDAKLIFNDCVFGYEESDIFGTYLNAGFSEGCVWPWTFSDWDAEDWGDPPVFDPERMEPYTIEGDMLCDTGWYGYMTVDPQSGETVYLPEDDTSGEGKSVSLELFEDGVGWMWFLDSAHDIKWELIDNTTASVETEMGNFYVTLYYYPDEEDSPLWMMLTANERIVWLY